MGDTETQPLEGGTGGRNRDVLRLLQTAIKNGHQMAEGPLAKAIAVAENMMENGEPRDKLRASEFIASLLTKGYEVGMYLDKNDRLDSGKLTENVKHDHAVVVKGIDTEAL